VDLLLEAPKLHLWQSVQKLKGVQYSGNLQ